MFLFKKIVSSIATVFVLVLGIWFIVVWYGFSYVPMYGKTKTKCTETTVKVPSGTGIRFLSCCLFKRNLIRNPKILVFLARFTGSAPLLRAGEYQIVNTTTPQKLLNEIITGNTKQRRITFIEGWTFRQVKKALSENPYIQHTINKLNNRKIMESLGDNHNPEGLFFPDTYFFTWGETDLQILHQAHSRMQTVLQKIWKKRSKNLPYKNPYQALIVASLIEKETASPKEYVEISGVILRRLKKSMLLQVDPTILYGLDFPYSRPITKKDLIAPTPYNTYRNHGLPPTPIDMPSYRSIWASVNPDSGNTLYYVARGDGNHVFSNTYRSHRIAIKKYQQRKNDKKSS
ncbi:endolytic transglycosylase MltG [Coxiella endosymbiont of Amblyomma sculptum]|uniref:endolytic transglycosylase MltG n=1 Tax=Coxiella endosymbiont of Amblyomma sculptum TaxID=2487929 RepID=UPI00132F479C|nr:endolytic transglycosylase MltG [Coxiella endosymbiont of Amblyomma sculptum]QHG92641.1 endolytic transglycosylase MltG [Coxiella endosymbiont of Amblyomma sculptum]